ncbi:MAG: protein translocase subunit SecDF [Bacteroidetes bacterium]|nr:protein translocase subunit SecDF [Bacteroidota bacterium]
MKNRGAVRAFTIILTLICLYYLSFSLITWRVESKAEKVAKKAAGENVELVAKFEKNYLDSMGPQKVYPVFGYTYDEAKAKKLNLGLDLQGGMHVTLEVAIDRLVKSMSGVKAGDPNFELLNKSLATAKEQQLTSQKEFVDLFYEAFKANAEGKTLFEVFDTRQNQGKFKKDGENPDQAVLDYIKEETSGAIERTTDILRTRIDKFGVTQPTIREEGNGRITIELPGADDVERVRKILQSSAELEFFETYTSAEFGEQYFAKINQVLADKLGLIDDTKTDEKDTTKKGDENFILSSDNDKKESTDNTVAESVSGDSTEGADATSIFEETKTDTTSIAGSDSTSQDSAAQKTNDQILAENPLLKYMSLAVDPSNNQYLRGPVAGYVGERDTAKIMEYLNYPEVKAVLPSEMQFRWSAKPINNDGNKIFTLICLKGRPDGSASLDGEVVVDAGLQFDLNGSPGVQMRMNAEGAKAWKILTGNNIERSIAIVLDGLVYSYPNVKGEIAGGVSSIDGDFTIDEAKDLANILKAGKLPISVDIVEEAVVGPTLGAKSITEGLRSLVMGFLLVLVFMALYYSRAGWVANLALLANLFFIMGTLASVQAALTLPGMAGIVLTIGMSVDANVLIFERIREELKAGKGVKQAVSDGYKNALTSIVDANVTTLLTAIILYVFGKGPISGFGVILLIGIVTSFFCAVFLSRLIFQRLLDKDRNVSFGSGATLKMFENFNWNFIGKRKIAYIVSSLVILAGLASLFTKGLNLSVDFKGGRSYIVEFTEAGDASSVNTVRGGLTQVFGSQPEVKTFGSIKTLKITTDYMIDSQDEDIDTKVQTALEGGLEQIVGKEKFEIVEGKKVGPTFARDIKIAAIWSIIIGLICIFIYIVIRFRKWQYGLGALAALFHDVLIVLSLFSIFWGLLPFNLEVDQAFIAAILTVVGYSINDTVVVFDRIRENMALHTRMALPDVINNALNKTVSRTFITSITTLLVIVVLFVAGGAIIRGFSFALLIGVVVGTYSSLFIASPIVVDFDKKNKMQEKAE